MCRHTYVLICSVASYNLKVLQIRLISRGRKMVATLAEVVDIMQKENTVGL